MFFTTCRKYNVRRGVHYINNVNNFKIKLDKTMPFWPSNIFSLLEHNEDKLFLTSMMTTRNAYMSTKDCVFAKKIEQRQHREDIMKRKRKMIESCYLIWVAVVIVIVKHYFYNMIETSNQHMSFLTCSSSICMLYPFDLHIITYCIISYCNLYYQKYSNIRIFDHLFIAHSYNQIWIQCKFTQVTCSSICTILLLY